MKNRQRWSSLSGAGIASFMSTNFFIGWLNFTASLRLRPKLCMRVILSRISCRQLTRRFFCSRKRFDFLSRSDLQFLSFHTKLRVMELCSILPDLGSSPINAKRLCIASLPLHLAAERFLCYIQSWRSDKSKDSTPWTGSAGLLSIFDAVEEYY